MFIEGISIVKFIDLDFDQEFALDENLRYWVNSIEAELPDNYEFHMVNKAHPGDRYI